MRRHPAQPIASELLRPKEIRYRRALLWAGVATAFLIIAVGWTVSKPWQVQASPNPETQPVPKFVNTLHDLKGMIEAGLQSIELPRSNESQ